MNTSDQASSNAKPAITENDIESKDLKRRSFLKGLGIFAGVTALGLTAAACKDDPATPESDPVDDDVNDDFDLD